MNECEDGTECNCIRCTISLSLFCAGKPQHLRFFAKLTMAWWTWPYWSRAWKTWSDKLKVLTYAIWSIHFFLLLFLFLLVGSKRHTMIIRHPNKQISVSLFLHQNNKMMNIFHGYRNKYNNHYLERKKKRISQVISRPLAATTFRFIATRIQIQ